MAKKSKAQAETSAEIEDRSNLSLYYQSFLVRVWRDDEKAPWRASITHVQTKETQHFVTVQALFIYLNDQMTSGS